MKTKKILAVLGAASVITAGLTSIPAMAAEEEGGGVDQAYTFTMEGESYTLPMKVSDFLAKGWEPDTSLDEFDHDMDGVSIMQKTLVKDGKYVYATVINFSQDAVPAEECYIGKVAVNTSTEGIAELETSEGISLGATAEEVEAAYGEPVDKEESYMTYSYSMQREIEEKEQMYEEAAENNEFVSQDVDLAVHGNIGDDEMTYSLDENGTVEEIELLNYALPEEILLQMLADASESEDEGAAAPETESVLPEELGDDIFSGNIEVMGTVYHFPVKVSDMEANGWFFEYEGTVPGKRPGEMVEVYWNNEKLGYVTVRNESDQAAPVSQCVVDKIDSEYTDIVLPGGIKKGSTLAELEAAVPDLQGMKDGDSIKKNGVSISVGDNYIEFLNEETMYTVELRLKEVNGESCVNSITVRLWQ